VSRALDVVLAALLLALAAPVLLVAAILIRLESGGPVMYRQRRVGLAGAPFELWKLRTMVAGAESMGAGIWVLEGDTRITRSGRVLRRFSLDELPNLLNVLRGEMAIVGPRPTVQAQVDAYTDRQRRRLEVKPGITGWAQVNGRASLPWPDRIELDVWYVEHRSLLLDIRILLRTAWMLLSGRGIYSDTLRQGW
jgi:lipopolysaccharide/colanic/teichoic acid biosynthesis glycosyltransferase